VRNGPALVFCYIESILFGLPLLQSLGSSIRLGHIAPAESRQPHVALVAKCGHMHIRRWLALDGLFFVVPKLSTHALPGVPVFKGPAALDVTLKDGLRSDGPRRGLADQRLTVVVPPFTTYTFAGVSGLERSFQFHVPLECTRACVGVGRWLALDRPLVVVPQDAALALSCSSRREWWPPLHITLKRSGADI